MDKQRDLNDWHSCCTAKGVCKPNLIHMGQATCSYAHKYPKAIVVINYNYALCPHNGLMEWTYLLKGKGK